MTSKLKPAIFYSLRGSPYASDWEIIAVTTEKLGPRGQLYGRDEAGVSVHAKPNYMHGRFASFERADSARRVLHQINRVHAGPIAEAEREWKRLRRLRDATITDAMKRLDVGELVVADD